MDKKLTLSIDENLIKFAHSYSKKTNQSISHLLEKHTERLRNEIANENLSEDTEELYGILQGKDIPDKSENRLLTSHPLVIWPIDSVLFIQRPHHPDPHRYL